MATSKGKPKGTRKAATKAEKIVQPAEVETVETPEVETVQEPEVKELTTAANVIWRGDKEPPSEVKMGVRTISLPSADEQRAGFYSADARALVLGVKGFKHFNRGR